jgi:hypothetical protein
MQVLSKSTYQPPKRKCRCSHCEAVFAYDPKTESIEEISRTPGSGSIVSWTVNCPACNAVNVDTNQGASGWHSDAMSEPDLDSELSSISWPTEESSRAWKSVLAEMRRHADDEMRREMNTLFGDMYQMRRRNPGQPLEYPRLIQSLPDGELRNLMQITWDLFKESPLEMLYRGQSEVTKAIQTGTRLKREAAI